MTTQQVSSADIARKIALAVGVVLVTAGVGVPASAANCLARMNDVTLAPLHDSPRVEITAPGIGVPPIGAECFEGTTADAGWVTVASTVEPVAAGDQLLARFGAISELSAVRYWSATDQAWRPLFQSSVAIVAADNPARRDDFLPDELHAGDSRYLALVDSRSQSTVRYRLRVLTSRPDRVIVEIQNLDAIRRWGITLYNAGGLTTVYAVSAQSQDAWAYYSITRMVAASFLARGHYESYVNRAVALYRHYMRMPTDLEPPAAP